MSDLTKVIQFNCPRATVEAVMSEAPAACLIVEPVMVNMGIVHPEPRFLLMLREICTERDPLLVFDGL